MFNLNEFTSLYRRILRVAGDSGAAIRIETNPLKASRFRVLTHVTVENQTNSFTKIRLGIHNRGVDYYLDELETVAADELCVSRSDILLGDGDRFFAELTGTTDDDVCIMTCVGWEQLSK